MDFNTNGVIERNDAFLLARANLDMVRFIRDLHVTAPDHRNHSTDCTLEITVKLSTRAGTMETKTNTQVLFEFSSEKTILSSQLRNTVFDAGELVTTYDSVSNLFGGIVKAESHDGSFQVRSRKSQIETSNVGFSMIQVIEDSWLHLNPVVTPLFMYSSVPRFPSAVRVSLTPKAVMVLKNGHSPQLTANFTESYATCQDPPVTNNVMLVFRNDYTDVQGKEESFSETITKDLTEKYQRVKIKNVRLTPGSILVYFDVITQKSRMKSTLVALWEMVKSGYTLHAGDTEYQAKPAMRVNGQDYHGNDVVPEADDNSKFTIGAVVGVCVAVTVIIGAVVCFCYKKRIIQQKERFIRKSESKVDILDSRSTSRMSNETRDHEMVLISGLYNGHFEYSDDDVSPSPGPSARNSFPLILQPEEQFAKRKLRKVESTSSQVSNEAWTESSSPALVRHQLKEARHSPPPPASSSKFKGPSPLGQLLSKQTSDSQFLMQETSSAEGSPLNLSPQVSKRVQNNLTHGSSDSSDEELVRSNTSSPVSAPTSARKSLTPQIKGSKLKDHSSEAFVFEKAVLYKRMTQQENGSQRSCKLNLLKSRVIGR